MKQMDRIESKIDRMDSKIDKHIEKIATNEASIGWIKGYVKVSVTLLITAIGSLLGWMFKLKG